MVAVTRWRVFVFCAHTNIPFSFLSSFLPAISLASFPVISSINNSSLPMTSAASCLRCCQLASLPSSSTFDKSIPRQRAPKHRSDFRRIDWRMCNHTSQSTLATTSPSMIDSSSRSRSWRYFSLLDLTRSTSEGRPDRLFWVDAC